jgi:small subunit ribosomal protein S18
VADFEEEYTEEEPSAPSSGPERRPRGRFGRKFVPRVRVCAFCVDRGAHIDYKQSDMLRRYLNDHGKIRPRRQTGTCAKHQRALAQAIKRARHLALLPFVGRGAR